MAVWRSGLGRTHNFAPPPHDELALSILRNMKLDQPSRIIGLDELVNKRQKVTACQGFWEVVRFNLRVGLLHNPGVTLRFPLSRYLLLSY